MKRRKRSGRALALFTLAVAALFADSALRPVTTQYSLVFERLPAAFDGFRIVQLSDVHGVVFGEGNARVLKQVAAAQPDLIALTGDLADGETEEGITAALLAALREIAPVYYVSGNHEWSEGLLPQLRELFAQYDIHYLRNEFLPLERAGARIVLAGVEDPNGPRDMKTPPVLCAEIAAAYPEDFVLLLGHRNDWIEKYPALDCDLILCGHAHGGIVRLPLLGGLFSTQRTLFPDYDAGVYESGRYRLVVSRGLGSVAKLPRFCNNPEIVCITLRCAQN